LPSSRAMLQRLVFSDLDDLDRQCGLWSRQELENMNSRFVAACERAFELGLESRAAASAMVRIGAVRNGDARRIEAAIEAGWQELCRHRGDISFAEIVQFVRKRCLVDPEVIRMGFAQRLRERGSEFWADPAPDLPAPRVDAVIRSNGSRRGGDHAQIRKGRLCPGAERSGARGRSAATNGEQVRQARGIVPASK